MYGYSGLRVVDGAIVRSDGGRIYRATDVASSLLDSTLGQDPVITELVLGLPQAAIMPGERILGTVRVPKIHFRYPVFKGEHLVRRDTRRGLKEPIGTVGMKAQWENGSLVRRTIAADFDDDELSQNASGDTASVLRLAQRGAWLAREIVRLDAEVARRDLLTTVTNYPVANRLAISGGSEWNAAGGDSKADINAMAAAVCAGSPLMKQQLTVFMSYSAFEAALADPVFTAARHNFSTDEGDAAVLAAYYGVKEVWTASPIESTSDDLADAVDLYGDIAIVYYDPDSASGGRMVNANELAGMMRFGARFAMNEGVGLRPFREDRSTSLLYPWQERELPAITWSKFGAIITNCST